MTRLLLFGAAGQAGRAIVAEAANRNHQVVAVTYRSVLSDDVTALPAVQVRRGDASDPESVRALLKATKPDVVVATVGGQGRGIYAAIAKTLVEAAAESDTRPRIVHFGGGATLTAPGGGRFLDLPGFPAEYLDPAAGQAAALDYYRNSEYRSWTYFSPPPVDFFIGERRGTYRTATDDPVTDDEGRSRLSYADAALAVLDEIETPQYMGKRFTAGY